MRLNPTRILLLAAFAAALPLTACIGNSEGMLSDDEKINRANRGREDYSNALRGQPGQQPGQAPTAPAPR